MTFIEFYQLPDLLRSRTIKPLFVLIFGRREEANRHINKRSQLGRNDEFLMTYDRLSPDSTIQNLITVKITSEGYEAIAIPPTLTLSPVFAEDHAIISNKEKAVLNNPYISKKRKEFLINRFSYWDEWSNSGAKCVINLGDEE